MLNRRHFITRAAALLPLSRVVGANAQTARPKPGAPSHHEPPPARTLDVRGIMAMYDLPDPRPNSIWHNYQDFFMFDARRGHRYDGNFWDRARWDHYLSLWSREGYNAVFWYGPNELMTGDQVLARFPEMPEAREIPREQSEPIIAQVKWLFRRAKSLGMKNYLYGDFIHYTRAFEKAHGLDKPMPKGPDVYWVYRDQLHYHCGVRNELTRRYTEALIYELCTTYENLDGFDAPMGECVPGDRSTFYSEAVVPGLKRSGRNLVFMVIAWQMPCEDYTKNVAPKDVYDNTWLGWHAYNAEQVTDPKPYPNLVGWAEALGLPTVSTFYPSNICWLPFNSPEFGCQMACEMKRIPNFRGYMHWEYSGRHLSPLFRKALAYYSHHDEAYSDEPWIAVLQEQFGSRAAAQHFLNAYKASARIIPEKSALVWDPVGFPRGELHLPYALMGGDVFQWSWAVSPVRTDPLQPIWHYAAWAAKFPKIFRNQNGSDWRTAHGSPLDYHQGVLWRTEGGSSYDTIPPVHMAKIRALGEHALAEAQLGLGKVTKNREEAEQAVKFMQAYQLLSAYYEKKVGAATNALIYSHSKLEPDRQNAEALADDALALYEKTVGFMHQELDPILQALYASPMKEMEGAYIGQGLTDLAGLLAAEKKERAQFAEFFFGGTDRMTDNFVG